MILKNCMKYKKEEKKGWLHEKKPTNGHFELYAESAWDQFSEIRNWLTPSVGRI